MINRAWLTSHIEGRVSDHLSSCAHHTLYHGPCERPYYLVYSFSYSEQTDDGQLRGLAPKPRDEGMIPFNSMEPYATRFGCSRIVKDRFQWKASDPEKTIVDGLRRLFPDIFAYLNSMHFSLFCPVVIVSKTSTKAVAVPTEEVNGTSIISYRNPARSTWTGQMLMFGEPIKYHSSN